MTMIEAAELTKEFRVFQRREGLRGALQDIFSRRYETLRAVDRVSFRIERGERVGYIGPNGAGKSTTIKMLTGILVPTSGRVQVAGLDPHHDREACLRRIGAVFGQRSQLWWDLAPVESFRLLASVYGVERAAREARLAELEGALAIGPYLRTPVRKLSLGEKMRCELAAALLHSPEVVFLDEPTIGLDLVAKEGIRRFLLEENRRRGTTFILTTHDLSDIEELCERVIIIDRGRLVFDGRLEDLKRLVGGESSLVFRLAEPGEGPLALLAELTRGLPVAWSSEDGAFRATFDPRSVPRAEVIHRVLERLQASDIAFAEPKIEDVVRAVYARSRQGAPP
ncbi:MAG: ATP-binding cassette domain-containing protein [Planctomycetes bacterium]|nr:ATP-binding cassette domain-containing protein [Planctomycetota bacterium]